MNPCGINVSYTSGNISGKDVSAIKTTVSKWFHTRNGNLSVAPIITLIRSSVVFPFGCNINNCVKTSARLRCLQLFPNTDFWVKTTNQKLCYRLVCVKGSGHLWWLSKTSILTLVCPNMCITNKYVKIWTQLVIEVAREWWKKNTLVAQIILCAFRCVENASGLSSYNIWMSRLPLSQKLRKFRGNRSPQCFILALYYSLPIKFLW